MSGASGPRSQLATGIPKPFLGRARIDGRQSARGGALEQSLGPVPAVLERRRQGLHEIDQLRIQERSADLEAAGHAGAIDLGQNVFGKVGILIEGQRTGEWIGAAAQRFGAVEMLLLDVDRRRRRPGAQRSRPRRTSPASADAPGEAARPLLGETA